MPFQYADASWPVPDDIARANRRAWERLAAPGSWWNGTERVAIAAEVRAARECRLCRERKQALSPFAVDGTHDASSALPEPATEATHRLVTDPGRLTRKWFESVIASGLEPARYVEIVGIVTTVVSIDAFHEGLGLPLEPLPAPEAGEAKRVLPEGLSDMGAYVAMVPASKVAAPEKDMYGGMPFTGNVIAAMSMVPDCVRQLVDLSGAYYIQMDQFFDHDLKRAALDRAQIELVAARVSALNECFY